MGAGIVRIFDQGLLKVPDGLLETLPGPLVPVIATLEIQIVGFIPVRRQRFSSRPDSLVITQGELNLVRYGLRDLAVNSQEATQFTIILPRPKVSLVFDLNELGGDSHLIGIAPHAAFQHVLDAEVTTNPVQWLLAVFVT